jgi:hypothetical protein
MAGLYIENNLSEKDLNLTDAVQKLYKTGIENDIRLFAFAKSLFSEIRSPFLVESTTINAEIRGFKNEPFTKSNGDVVKRTKFLTNSYTFSTNNFVWFEKLSSESGFVLDRRNASELGEGSSIVVSTNGSLANLQTISAGSQYKIETFHSNGSFVIGQNYTISSVGDMDWTQVGVGAGIEVVVGLKFTATATGDGSSSPTKTGVAYTDLQTSEYTDTNNTKAIQVNVIGETSGASNAVIEVYLKQDGSLDITQRAKIIQPGSGYFEEEDISILSHCQINRYGVQETSINTKCKNYPNGSNRIVHAVFKHDVSPTEIGFKAVFRPIKYSYEVKVGTDDGFFLYNTFEEKYVYLGSFYDSTVLMPNPPTSEDPLLVLRRKDKIVTKNFFNIKNLNASSFITSHDINASYRPFSKESFNLDSSLRTLSDDVSEIRDSFRYLVQNSKRQRLSEDPLNKLSSKYNIFAGKNFDGTFRCILRDPDGVLDQASPTFADLSSLTSQEQIEVEIAGENIICPGIYINTGGSYKRAFSVDEKPFKSQRGLKLLSPKVYGLTTGTDYSVDANYSEVNTGTDKYSISTAYYKGGSTTDVVGFEMHLGTLVQNLGGTNNNNGGFVFSSTQTEEDIQTGGVIKSFPLFSYTNIGTTYSPRFLFVP